jgi:hypothetical protein
VTPVYHYLPKSAICEKAPHGISPVGMIIWIAQDCGFSANFGYCRGVTRYNRRSN